MQHQNVPPKKIVVLGDKEHVEAFMRRHADTLKITRKMTNFYDAPLTKKKQASYLDSEPENEIYGIGYYLSEEYDFIHVNPNFEIVKYNSLNTRFTQKYYAALLVLPIQPVHDIAREKIDLAGNHFIVVDGTQEYSEQWFETQFRAPRFGDELIEPSALAGITGKEIKQPSPEVACSHSPKLTVAILGRTDEVKSFIKTNATQLLITEGPVNMQYKFFTNLGMEIFVSKEIVFQHLCLEKNKSFQLFIKKSDSILIINPTDYLRQQAGTARAGVVEIDYVPGTQVDAVKLTSQLKNIKTYGTIVVEPLPSGRVVQSDTQTAKKAP